MTIATHSQNTAPAHDKTSSISIPGISIAILSALILLYFAGFAGASQYHDAAHDTRHTLAFPCH